MARELERTEEETVRKAAVDTGVVLAVRAHDRTQVWDAAQDAHGETAVHESVVNEDVGAPEDRHPEADPEGNVAPHSRSSCAALENERDRHRRVESAQEIVPLESPATRLMMRSMHAPETRVPHLRVQERSPGIHRERSAERDRKPHGCGLERRVHPAPRRSGR
jgi:hypothetical protein